MLAKPSKLTAFLFGTGLGYVLWAASPLITNRREPWDSDSAYYVVCLFGAGFAAGFVSKAFWKMGVAGIYVGQAVAIMITSGGQLGLFIPIGAAVLAFYTLLSGLGAFMAVQIRNSRPKS